MNMYWLNFATGLIFSALFQMKDPKINNKEASEDLKDKIGKIIIKSKVQNKTLHKILKGLKEKNNKHYDGFTK
jgi:hypothetical protein